MKSGMFGITGMVAGNAIDAVRGSIAQTGVTPEQLAVATGPIIKDDNSGSFSEPIVSAINTNMTSVVELLSQLVKASGGNEPNNKAGTYNSSLATRTPATYRNTDNTNEMNITDYQKLV